MNEIQKNIIVTIAIAAIVSFGVVSFLRPTFDQFGGYTEGYWDSAGGYKIDGTTVIDGSGAITGATTLTMTGETNLDTLVQGGDVGIIGYGTTTATAAQICNSSVIQIGLLSDAVATLTLPTATTLHSDCLDTNGDTKTILVQNIATSTMAMTIVAGSGIELLEHVGEGDVVIAATDNARILFSRVSVTTSTAEVINLQVAD